jgi:hypothetical protein
MYEKEVTVYEYVYSQSERNRMIVIHGEIKKILEKDFFESDKLHKLVDELNDILRGHWSEPMPF